MPDARCAETACAYNDACGGREANSIYASPIGGAAPSCMTRASATPGRAGRATGAIEPDGKPCAGKGGAR